MTDKVECPICHKMLDKRGLNGHLRTHKTESKPDTQEQTGTEPETEDFTFEEKTKKQDPETYKCGVCGAEIKHGQEVCSGCGGVFEW